MMFIFLKLVFAILPPNTILTVDVMQEIIVESDWLYNELLTSEDYLSTRTSSLESGSDFWYAVANQLAEQLDTIVQQQTLTELRIHLAQSQIQSRLVSLCSETNLRAMLQLIEKETQIITPYVVAEAFELCAMSVISAEDLLRHAANLLPEGLVVNLANISKNLEMSHREEDRTSSHNRPSSMNELVQEIPSFRFPKAFEKSQQRTANSTLLPKQTNSHVLEIGNFLNKEPSFSEFAEKNTLDLSGTDLIEELGFLSPEQLLSRTTSGEQGFYNKLLSLPETNINDNDTHHSENDKASVGKSFPDQVAEDSHLLFNANSSHMIQRPGIGALVRKHMDHRAPSNQQRKRIRYWVLEAKK